MRFSGIAEKTKLHWAIGCVAMAVMMQQVLFTRLFSVTLFYHYAFLVIALTMLGLTAGALVVHRCKRWMAVRGEPFIAGAAALSAGLCTLLVLVIQTHCRMLTEEGITAIAGNALLLLPGFTLTGIAVTLLLMCDRGQESTRYAFDLCGAALGCVVTILLLAQAGVLNSLLCTVLLYALAACLCVRVQRVRLMAEITMLAVSLLLVANMNIVPGLSPVLRLHYVRGAPDRATLFESWNSYSRVTGTHMMQAGVEAVQIAIDEKALTSIRHFEGDPALITKPDSDIRYVGYQLRVPSSALVIGVGGGYDVLAARAYHVPEITGLEMNNAIYRLLTEDYARFSGYMAKWPGIHIINTEARSYLEASDAQFGFLQVSMIDTWAATAAGALALSENGLYTVDAWQAFWRRLSPDGMMSFTRWYHPRAHPGELYRMLALARETLRREGIEEVRDHVVVLYGEDRATLLVSKSPIGAKEFKHFTKSMAAVNIKLLLSPFDPSPSPLARILEGDHVAAIENEARLDLSPPTDNRPFFFHMISLRQVLQGLYGDHARGPNAFYSFANEFNIEAVKLLFAMLAAVSCIAVGMVSWPMLRAPKHGAMKTGWEDVAYFALIGFGFMLVEMGLLQRLTLFLGHPAYALAVVLSVLLFSSGLGSLYTRGVDAQRHGARTIFSLCCVLAVVVGLSGTLLHITKHMNEAWRIGMAILFLCPAGFAMGTALPLGLNLLARRGKEAIAPWMWGINGAASVVASVLAVLVSLFFGISMTLWLGVLCYMALYALLRTRFR